MDNLPEYKEPEYKSQETIGFYSTAANQTSEYVRTKKGLKLRQPYVML